MAMALRGPCPTLLLTVGMFMAWLALASGYICPPEYKRFLWRHVDFPKTKPNYPYTYCNFMMKKKGVSQKPQHTFIHEPIWKVKNLCYYNKSGWYKSIDLFHITKCILKYPDCYKGVSLHQKIVVLCKKGFPVDIKENRKDSPCGCRADGEPLESLESWSTPSNQYTAPESSSTSEYCSDDSHVSSSQPFTTPSDHCTI